MGVHNITRQLDLTYACEVNSLTSASSSVSLVIKIICFYHCIVKFLTNANQFLIFSLQSTAPEDLFTILLKVS